ncbi:hypothetical protein [Gilvibacter sediminis]|uniref:hypothetical protein n=1 Tax=Gilvibacter sediminis TaxID=379071 RepID=UPI00234FBCDF|nr:hypothetical protein [Gilvibacter sediminis]MDC7997525.1 hypothetical protein [Gilvibacter sediminis]
MKNILILMLALTTSAAFAQRGHRGPNPQHGPQAEMLKDFSAEQLAQLETKKLTLALDLDADQQLAMLEVQTKIAQDKKAMMEAAKARKEADEIKKLTSEQRFEKMDAALDKKIAIKAEIKSILNADQYEKWEKMQHEKKRGRKGRHAKRK